MARLFKPDIQYLHLTVEKLQIGLETLVMDFLLYDLDEVENEVTSLYNQSRLLDITLSSILYRSSLLGKIYWKKQNWQLINCISRSCTAMNHLRGKLKELHDDVDRGSICDSSICALVIVWHRFVLSLKPTIRGLEQRPSRRKRSSHSNCMISA